MHRRDFVRLMALAAPAVGLNRRALFAQAAPSGWRTYEVATTIQILDASGPTRISLPLPMIGDTTFQQVLSSDSHCDSGKTSIHEDKRQGLRILVAEFPAGVPAKLTTTVRIQTRGWSVPLDGASSVVAPSRSSAAEFLKPTRYAPTGGIVKKTSGEITRGATSDIDKVHAIYEWIVENTYRDPKVRGCGRGDIRSMLETGNLGGKCADINALFVGLVKASGVPARDVYGIRIGRTNLEAKCLGTSSEHIEKSQHCRAEVFLTGFGWVPMDPADVRKVMLEELPGNLPINDSKVERVRKRLFGSWEMNWMAYNYAQDVSLPGSTGEPLPFLMYPQAETAQGRLDSLDPDSFRYEIASHELIS